MIALLAAAGAGCADDPGAGAGVAGSAGASGAGNAAGSAGSGAAGGGGTGGLPEAGACEPEGAFSLVYSGEGCTGSDTVFVHRDDDGALHARFAGRRPAPSWCGPTDTVSFTSSASLDGTSCTLTVGFDSAWCYSGEGQCVEVEARLDATVGTTGDGSASLRRCWDSTVGGTPRACSVAVTRLSTPAQCEGAAHGAPCSGSAVCDSGCGSPCTCTGGAWSCTFPPTGETCDGDEACVVQASPLGGFDDLSCRTPPGGEPQLGGSLTLGGTVCPTQAPTPGFFCTAYPRGLRCEYGLGGGQVQHCSCEAGDGGTDLWTCGP